MGVKLEIIGVDNDTDSSSSQPANSKFVAQLDQPEQIEQIRYLHYRRPTCM